MRSLLCACAVFLFVALVAFAQPTGGDNVAALLDIVKDDKAPAEKRIRAINELGLAKQADAKVVTALTEVLQDKNPKVRAAAVDALGSLGPGAKASIPALLELLGNEETDPDGVGLRAGAEPRVSHALARIGPDAVPGLVKVLGDEDKEPLARYQAARALSDLGRKARPALPALEAAMKDKSVPVAAESACGYARAGGDLDKTLPVLVKGLQHESPVGILIAASAAERLGNWAKGLVTDLTPLLRQDTREVRIAAAHALSRMGPAAKPAVPAMANLLKSPDRRERSQVAIALARLGPDAREALPALTDRLADLEKTSPNPILVAIGSLGPDAKPVVPALLKLLEEPDDLLGDEVVTTLGQIGPEAKTAVPAIAARLDSSSGVARARAARALGRIGPAAEPTVLALKKRLEDDRKPVRVWAAFALARVTGDSKTYVPMLVEAWNADRPEGGPRPGAVRFEVAQALELLGPEAKPAREVLVEGFLDEKTPPETREFVARALGQLGEDAEAIVPKVVSLFERKIEGDRRAETFRQAILVLELFGPKAKAAAPALRKLADDDDNTVADAVARALKKIEGK